MRAPNRLIVLISMLTIGAGTAHAGRRLLSWAYDTETLPERGIELEQWLSERTGEPTGGNAYELLWSLTIGITDQLEIGFPVEWIWEQPAMPGGGAATDIYRYGVDLRWRLVTSDPVSAPRIVPLARLALYRPLLDGERDHLEIEANLVLTTDVLPRVHLLLDVGADVVTTDTPQIESNYKLGGSVSVSDELRVGAMVWLNLVHQSPFAGDHGWLAAGPDLSWTHGRFWLTAGIQFGLTSGDAASPVFQPRVTWGVLF